VLLLVPVLYVPVAHGASGDVLFSDDFDDGSLSFWTAQGTDPDRVGEEPVRLESPKVDLIKNADWIYRSGSVAATMISVISPNRVRMPSSSTRIPRTTGSRSRHSLAGAAGEIFPPSYSLPNDALHKNFQLRLRHTGGSGDGTWSSVISGIGTLSDATAGDGTAEYTFPGGEAAVTLAFNYTQLAGADETVDFDVNGGNEKAGEDPDLTISDSGFRITDGAGTPINVPTQIASKPSYTAPDAQSLGLQAIEMSSGDPTECEPAFPDGTTTSVDTSDDNGGAGAASYEPVSLLFGANAEAAIVLEYPDAGAIQFHARFDPIDDSGDAPIVEAITGARNDFVVRPFGFALDFDPDGDGTLDDREANGTCGGQTSCAADASGDVLATARPTRTRPCSITCSRSTSAERPAPRRSISRARCLRPAAARAAASAVHPALAASVVATRPPPGSPEARLASST
jgi:hypothetical protein